MAKGIRPGGSTSIRAFEKAANKAIPGLLGSLRGDPIARMVRFDSELDVPVVMADDPKRASAYISAFHKAIDVANENPGAVEKALAEEYGDGRTAGEFKRNIEDKIAILEEWKKKK